MKKFLFGICAAVLTVVSIIPSSLTLEWNKNSEPDVDHYCLWRAANGGGYVPTVAASTNFTYADIQSGNSYSFYVTAVNTNQLESLPSATLAFTPAPLPPPLNVQRVTVQNAITSTTWGNVSVFFDTVNLATYQATSYTITATASGGATVQVFATNSPAVFPILAVQNYTFSAAIVNATGTSPTGGTVFLSGQAPGSVTGLKVQVGP